VTAFSTGYDSDPDVFITKMVPGEFKDYPTNSIEADWFAERVGSDTVFIEKENIQIGDVFYITVRCNNECVYDLRTYYAREEDITDKQGEVYRWGGHSSAYLTYYIAEFTGAGATERIEIKFEPEGNYKYIDVFISFDKNFNLIEDKPHYHLLDSGVAVMLNKRDYRWCVDCTLYILVNMIEDRRLYITSDAFSSVTGTMASGVKRKFLVNSGKTECLSYSIAS